MADTEQEILERMERNLPGNCLRHEAGCEELSNHRWAVRHCLDVKNAELDARDVEIHALQSQIAELKAIVKAAVMEALDAETKK